ncbi:hypothetical protein TSMEX_010791 [Taenia solium]|eukprot:TsM_000458700 transcript=TsM_000458700 gene=TsM_000458700
MSILPSIVHSLPANVDADGTNLGLSEEFAKAGVPNSDSETVYTSHFRGRKLCGKVFLTPTDSEALVVQGDDMHSLEEVPSVMRVVGGPIEKLVIWNTDVHCDVPERLRLALIWSKLNASLPR